MANFTWGNLSSRVPAPVRSAGCKRVLLWKLTCTRCSFNIFSSATVGVPQLDAQPRACRTAIAESKPALIEPVTPWDMSTRKKQPCLSEGLASPSVTFLALTADGTMKLLANVPADASVRSAGGTSWVI